MNTQSRLLCAAVVVVALLAISGMASGAHTIPPLGTTEGLQVVTHASVNGMFMSHSDVVIRQSNDMGSLNDMPLQAGQSIATTGYYEDTIAVDGQTNYTKTLEASTKGMIDTETQKNIQSDRIINFESNGNGGRMTSDEGIMIDVVGNSQDTDSAGCCAPFNVGADDSILPSEDETVMAGSRMDVTEVSAHTQASSRIIADSGDVPVSLDYTFDAHGLNQTDPNDHANGAIGSATVYVNGNIQTGLGGDYEDNALGGQMTFEDSTTVDGVFDLAKDISYKSSP